MDKGIKLYGILNGCNIDCGSEVTYIDPINN